jgi:hypothetical protein
MMYQVEVFVGRRAILGSFFFSILFAIMTLSASATGSVSLAWNASTNPIVTGYNVYYGCACGTYTNELSVGNATNVTISGLVEGATYYFAATTHTAASVESPFSSELSYQVLPFVNYSNSYTAVYCTNIVRVRTITLPSGRIIIAQYPPVSTNYVFTGFWISQPPAGAWKLQSSSNLLTWSDYSTGTNAVFIHVTNGNWFFRFKSS